MEKFLNKNTIVFLVLLLVLLFVYSLRYQDIDYSLPTGEVFGHTKSYVNDEDAVVADTGKLALAFNENPIKIFDPGQTVYPTFGRYLSLIPLAFSLKNYKNLNFQEIANSSPQEQSFFYSKITYSGRIISFIASFLTIIIFFLICLELGIHRYLTLGLSFIYSFIPLDIGLSIQSKSNALMVFIILIILYFCISWMKNERDWQIGVAALLVGVATGACLNGFLSIFIVILAILLKYRFEFYKFFFRRYNFLIIFLPALGLLISAPSLAIHPNYIVAMLNNAGSGSLIFSPQMDFLNIKSTLILLGGSRIGLFLFIITFFLSIYLIIKGSIEKKLLAAYFLFYLAIYCQTTVAVPRYAHSLLPVWLLIFALGINSFLSSTPRASLKISAVILLFLLGAETVFFGLAYIKLFSQKSIRLEAWDYIEKNIPEGSEIGVYYNSEYYASIPIDYRKYKIYPCRDYERGLIERESFNFQPEYLAVEAGKEECLEKVFNISNNYSLIKKLEKELSFAGLDFRVNGHWNYFRPDIFIYKRL